MKKTKKIATFVATILTLTTTAIATPVAAATSSATSSSVIRQLGDVSGNGKIEASDAAMVLDYYAQLSTDSTISIPSKYLLDTNRDGKVTAYDATAILEYYASAAANEAPSWPEFNIQLNSVYVIPGESTAITDGQNGDFILRPGEYFTITAIANNTLVLEIPKANRPFYLELTQDIKDTICLVG